MSANEVGYVIATWEIGDVDILEKLDTKNSSQEKDGTTIKIPSQLNVCRLQLWEVYVAVAILILQPHSSVIFAHVKALCEHNDPYHLCEAVLKEHLCIGNVTDESQFVTMYTFFDEYFNRKFQIAFAKHSLHRYVTEALDDPLCGKDGIPRVFLLGPHVTAFLLNSQYFDGQYDELLDAMRMANLPVNDLLQDGDQEIGEALDIEWDNVRLYDDPNLILKKYGGWAVSKSVSQVTPKDALVMRLTGCSLEQILAGREVPDSPRGGLDEAETLARLNKERLGSKGRRRRSSLLRPDSTGGGPDPAAGDEESDSDASSHPSDFDVDPEHPKVVPLGVTLCEMYVLLRGLLRGLDSSSADWHGSVVGDRVARGSRDGHILASAVLIDLYMRDQIEVSHWTLSEGNVAVAYKVQRKRGHASMEHFLDDYTRDAEAIFRDMLLPSDIGEAPILASLEERGVIDNHRPSWERAWGCGFSHVDVWDFARPDVLLDLKEGYLTSARVLYDKSFTDPLHEESNDVLMFCHVLQCLFDMSLEAIDGMTRVLSHFCPPFEKGELFPPMLMVHSSAVCQGLIDRGFRVANSSDTQLAMEAAEFNEAVMERLEDKFFLSSKVWESFDADHSGELSLEEFVQGMRGVDVYKDFRRERVPDDVLQTIVTDLAERLFHEVDINMDGTLTPQELQIAFRRRRDEATKRKESRQWMKRAAESMATQMGFRSDRRKVDQAREEAVKLRKSERAQSFLLERRDQNEWQAEVELPELLDHDMDVDTNFTTNIQS